MIIVISRAYTKNEKNTNRKIKLKTKKKIWRCDRVLYNKSHRDIVIIRCENRSFCRISARSFWHNDFLHRRRTSISSKTHCFKKKTITKFGRQIYTQNDVVTHKKEGNSIINQNISVKIMIIIWKKKIKKIKKKLRVLLSFSIVGLTSALGRRLWSAH